MEILFHQDAWEDYQYFQKNDIKIIEKINQLIKDITKSPFLGIGKPEALKYNLSGNWSRRINHEHRLVYTIKNKTVYILQCRYHY
ncbi:Txe/YoeB family addiction module toxin [Rickettsia endosymbiont of Halotydeus destructor]|uniref:Txe/YoeB family addiction module toxin n=1 Tax=Rickettsia endosymbiont of Halotydeus destructor TaxID=2996754 RepID=UPI003BAEDB5C